MMDRKLLFAILASAVVGVLLWHNPAVYPFKLLVVLMHESGHAAAALLVFLASFSALYALFDIRDDLLHLGPPRGSDADALAQITFIPAIVWGIGWGLLSLALLGLTLRNVLAAPPVRAAPAAKA